MEKLLQFLIEASTSSAGIVHRGSTEALSESSGLPRLGSLEEYESPTNRDSYKLFRSRMPRLLVLLWT